MTGTLRRAGQFAIIAILLAAFTLNIASAATIKLGSVREQTINWLMESKHLSPAAAEQSLRHYERQNRSEILDTIGIPDGAVADFVTVDGESGTVTEDGCGLIFSPGSEYGRKFWQQVESTRGTPAYDHLKANMARAVEQGVFVQKLTQEQQQRIQDVVAGRHRDRPSLTPTEVRVLVIGTRMPQFDDFSPTPTKVLVAELLAAATPNGNLVNIDYTAYDEAAQVDVAGYEIYFETATGPTAGLSPIAAVGPGTQTLQLPTGGPGPDRYVAVAVPDEVPNVETPVNWVLVTTADTAAPLLTSPNPFDGQTEVALGANISFRVEDAGSGVAAAAISVRIKQDPADGGAWTDITGDLVIGSNSANRTVDYDPPVDFLYNQTVTVEVTATDVAGNTLVDTFSFLTRSDVNAPQFQNAVPADGAVDVPIDTDIDFELTDDRSGVDPTSIRVTVDGTNVSASLTLGGTPDLTTVSYDPPTDFAYGAVVDVTVDASDEAGNAMATVNYSFTILPDTAGVVIDQLAPADTATDVPIDTDISFRASDAISGVDTATIALTIAGTPVVLAPANLNQVSPTSVIVTYDPGDFAYSTNVAVEASAQDLAGNPATVVNWSFVTEDPPTYSITGTITEDAPNQVAALVGVVGVNVNITEVATGNLLQTVVSAGTGVFQAFGLFDGTYLVEPVLTDYTFAAAAGGTPSQTVYVGLTPPGGGPPPWDAAGVDFLATRTLYTIEGTVTEAGVGLAGVVVTDGTRTATTAADGTYSIADVPSGTYAVSPTLTNYDFSPVSQTAVVASDKATDIDFAGVARTFSVSGTVTDLTGNRLSGVEVRMVGGTGVAVTSQAGQYTLNGVKAGTQALAATRAGFLFESAPGVDASNLDVTGDLTGVDFLGFPVVSRTFLAGVRFLAVPVEPRDDDAATVFGTTDVARYSATSTPPRYFSAQSEPDSAVLDVKPGAGFFVRLLAATTVDVPGTPVSVTAPYAFVIDDGWTMAGNPYPTALGFGHLVPNVAGAMAPYGFVLNNGQYDIVSNVPALGGRAYVDGWEGMWLLGSGTGTTITAMPPGTTTAGVGSTPERAVDRDNWLLPIVAQAGGSVDSSNAVGVSSAGAIAVSNPPPLPDSVDVVIHGDRNAALAYDLKSSVGTGVSWDFSVVTNLQNAGVTVALPDLSELPGDLTATLVDLGTGKRMYARTMPSYGFNSGQGGARDFRLEIERRQTAGLSIRSAGVNIAGGAASITYVLSAEADIQARVVNIAGQTVRTLARSGGMVVAGTNTLTWDLLGDTQTRVPNGLYMVTIEAKAADGQRVRSIQSIVVAR